jgi:hypothetical protein
VTVQTAVAERQDPAVKLESARMLSRGSEYLPATFEERGVAISFTTPKLNQARIRRNERQGLELLVPDFADSGATYVMPWGVLPEVVSMTLHDRELHKLITNKPGLTPWEMRRLQMEIGARGLAGPSAAMASRQALGEDDRLRLAANFALIQKVFGFLGFETAGLKASSFLTVETQTHVRRAFQALGKEISASPEQCYGAIAEQSASLAQIGVPGADQPGRLRRIIQDMRSLVSSVDGWAAGAYSEHAGKANMIARVAEQTVMIADYDLDRLDRRIRDIARFVKNWQREAQEVRHLANRLYWLLDGWDHITAAWFTGIDKSEIDTIDAMHDIERVLPRVPRKEVESMPQFASGEVKVHGGRRVTAMQDWRTKSRDADLIRRLETVKGVTP